MRLAVIDSLGGMGDKHAVQPLWLLREDVDSDVAYNALRTALALGGATFYDDMVELATSPDSNLR